MLIDERKNGNEEYHRTQIVIRETFGKILQMKSTEQIILITSPGKITAKAYKEAVANVEAGSANAETNEGAVLEGPAKVKVKKKRSIIGEHYYEEFSTEFWKERGRQRHNVGAINIGTTTSNIPSRSQQSRISKPIVATSSASTSGSRTASRTGTASKIPRAISSPNRSRPTTPSVPSSGSR